jgi:hypothetical protein
MKAEDTHCDNDPYQDEYDNHPKGSPIFIILVVVILASLVMAFSTTVANAANSSRSGGADSPNPVKDWKPPVAPKVTLPAMVDDKQARTIADQWGVELTSLRLTAGGYMIDFRFRVLDVEKSREFFDHRIKPHLVVERSNAKLPVPMAAKVGAFRTTNRGQNIKPNKTYYMVFGNPDAHVKSGEKVTMVIGDFKAEHLTVY